MTTTYTLNDRNKAAATYRATMTTSQLRTAVSRAERNAAAAGHKAAIAQHKDAALNSAAISAERNRCELRAALWEN